MALLRLLGGLSLCDAGGAEIQGITAQPKRIALLACVALAGRTGVRRDTLLAFLWPELDAERARHALRQSLYVLRRELPDALVANGDDAVRIDPAVLRCDVIEFQAALDARDPARALDLYRGDLLPGFYLGGCVEFEQWLESERHRLRQRAVEAATALARTASAAGEHADAARWARRATELAPFDEPLLRLHLEVLEAAGDVAGALVAYESFATRARRELGIDPGEETGAIVARIRTRGAPRRRRRRSLSVAGIPPLPPAPESTPHRRFRYAYLVLLVSVLLGSFMVVLESWRNAAVELDPALIVILPFRLLSSTADSLAYTEGVADLLFIALQPGGARGGEPRVVDAAVSAQRWRAALAGERGNENADLARVVARSLGAGLVLHGSAMLQGEQLILTAALSDVDEREPRAAASVTGRPQELVTLVQQLAALTLAPLMREDPLRLPQLVGTSWPAVQSYLAGRSAARRGRYDEAYALLEHALQLDSTFALAALELVDVSGWSNLGPGLDHYERLAFRHRDRLGPRDTAYLRAWIGFRAYTGHVTGADMFAATASALRIMPDRPGALYRLGDRYYHSGMHLQRAEPLRNARVLFERAFALDSGFAPAREHLLEIAVHERDRREARRQRRILLEHEPHGIRTPYLRWLAAHFLDDVREQRRMRAALDTMNRVSLVNVIRTAQEAGLGLSDAVSAARALRRIAADSTEVAQAMTLSETLHHNLGRPTAALALRPLRDITPETPPGQLARVVRLALFTDYTPPALPQVLTELERRSDRPPLRFWLHVWRLSQRDTTGAAATLALLRASPPPGEDSLASLSDWEMRIALLEALLEHATGTPGERRGGPALLRLDSMARSSVGDATTANLVLVLLFSENGEPQRALDAARRRLLGTGPALDYLAPLLRAEARLAAATGDLEGARRAYRHYLALRQSPEPGVRPQVDSVRAEYARLR